MKAVAVTMLSRTVMDGLQKYDAFQNGNGGII